MRALVCSICGAANSVRSVMAGMSAFGLEVVPLRCRRCGERSSALRGFGSYAGFFVFYAAAFLGLFFAGAVLLPRVDHLFVIIGAALLPALLLPPLFAWSFLRRTPAAAAAVTGDLSTPRKVACLAGGLAIALLLIIAGIAAYVVWDVTSRKPADPAAAEVVELDAAALDWRCVTLAGEEIALGDLFDEVVFLNVWATWCRPCIAELPSIRALRDEVAGAGVRFLLVSDEAPDTVREFAAEHELDLPFATGGRLPAALYTAAIPATFVLHRGRIVYRHIGGADWNDPDFRSWLQDL